MGIIEQFSNKWTALIPAGMNIVAVVFIIDVESVFSGAPSVVVLLKCSFSYHY